MGQEEPLSATLEDAWTLGQLAGGRRRGLARSVRALRRHTPWQRNAPVQRQSQRNGTLFHASGPLRLARNAAMAQLGESTIDEPWLYSGPPEPV